VKTGKHTHIALLLLLGALGGTGLSAQEGYSYAFKARGGLLAGDLQTTHFDNKIMSFGAEVRKEMFGPGCALTFELAWEYVPGRNYSVMKPVKGDNLDIFNNFDARKEYGQGFLYKAAYNAPLKPFSWAPDDIEWFGGISLDMHSVRTEIEYTLFHPSAPGNPTLYPGTGWPSNFTDAQKYQGDSFVEQSTAISPSIFAGLRKKIGQGTACELTLRNFGMRHHDYTPGIYFGSTTGKLESGTSRGWSLEFALSVKI
jgi:hypothetical protein